MSNNFMKTGQVVKSVKRVLVGLCLLTFFSQGALAGFPDDFSDVTWIDPDISSWRQTARITANVSGSRLIINDTKRTVWPRRFHTTLNSDCCNRSLWVFIKNRGRWYATTFEYMRFGQTDKIADTVRGRQIKRTPFLRPGYEWRPAKGEVYGFMTSGMARFNFDNVNVRERSNIALYRWEEGPTNNINFEEVPRGPDGRPIFPGDEVDPPEVEEPVCVPPETPEPVVNTHVYRGTATGTLVVTGGINLTETFTEAVSVTVSDDRSLTFVVDGESFTTAVRQDNTFNGRFTFDIGGLGVCIVNVDVAGVINGKTSTGSATGREQCSINTARFDATYSATSATAPSFLDQRPPIEPPKNPCTTPIIAPLIDILLDD